MVHGTNDCIIVVAGEFGSTLFRVLCEGLVINLLLLLALSLPPLIATYSSLMSWATPTSFRVGIVLGLCNPATIYATGGQSQIFAASLVSVYLYLTVSLALWSTAFIAFTSFCVRYWIPICKLFSCLTHRRQAKRALREASCLCESWRGTFYRTLLVRIRSSVDRMPSLVKQVMVAFNIPTSS